jgi:transposase
VILFEVFSQRDRPENRHTNPVSGAISNGGTEAINGIIKLHRRVARGFPNPRNYRLRMISVTGQITHPNLR